MRRGQDRHRNPHRWIEAANRRAAVGRQLLCQSDKLFEYWHKVRNGLIQRSTFLQSMAWLRPMVRSSLQRGPECTCTKTTATCGELLRPWDCLWTFTRAEGVEPTDVLLAEEVLEFLGQSTGCLTVGRTPIRKKKSGSSADSMTDFNGRLSF